MKIEIQYAAYPERLECGHRAGGIGFNSRKAIDKMGYFFIKGEGELPTPKPSKACKIHEQHLIASVPLNLDLLWEIENHLCPTAPGQYALTKRALHFHAGDPYALIELIERGLLAPIPEPTKTMILQQPSIRIADGIVLEFSSPQELQQLRRQPVFRKYIDEFLSPQRVLVSREKSEGLFKILKRRGVYVHRNEEQAEVGKKRKYFPSSRKNLLQPVGRNFPKLSILERYKELGQGLDILYHAPGYPAEQRRITPLVTKQIGEQTYVITYCQTRRAQRTFRLV